MRNLAHKFDWKRGNGMVKQLIKTYEEYVKLLVGELEEIVPLAASHGWQSFRHEAGKLFREKIAAQKAEVLAQLSLNKPIE